jgi:hypothetical protein
MHTFHRTNAVGRLAGLMTLSVLLALGLIAVPCAEGKTKKLNLKAGKSRAAPEVDDSADPYEREKAAEEEADEATVINKFIVADPCADGDRGESLGDDEDVLADEDETAVAADNQIRRVKVDLDGDLGHTQTHLAGQHAQPRQAVEVDMKGMTDPHDRQALRDKAAAFAESENAAPAGETRQWEGPLRNAVNGVDEMLATRRDRDAETDDETFEMYVAEDEAPEAFAVARDEGFSDPMAGAMFGGNAEAEAAGSGDSVKSDETFDMGQAVGMIADDTGASQKLGRMSLHARVNRVSRQGAQTRRLPAAAFSAYVTSLYRPAWRHALQPTQQFAATAANATAAKRGPWGAVLLASFLAVLVFLGGRFLAARIRAPHRPQRPRLLRH